MDSTNWTRENIAWFAGLFEGEGSIQIDDHGFYLTINMTDEDVLQRVVSLMRCGSVTGPASRSLDRHKPIWKWKVRRATDSYAVLVAIWPYLLSRRQAKASDALRLFASSPAVQKRLHGTWSSYSKRNCRCDLCVEAGRLARLRFLAKRAKTVHAG